MAPATRKSRNGPGPGPRDTSTLPHLPAEIWWLVLQDFQARLDFGSLYNCALVSESMAHLALPLLYSIYEHSEASAGDASVFDKSKLIRLWRSIILSSVGHTSYPYCLWIKALRLGSVDILLQDIGRDKIRKAELFAPPLGAFRLEKGISKTRGSKGPMLDIDKITYMVADKITSFVKDAADREDRVVALASLEGHTLLPAYLPTWVSRLSLLSSLTLRDGSVLGAETAEAIRKHCPLFRELVCHWCMGDGSDRVDQNLAAFFRGLPEDSLASFNLISIHQIGEETFKALCHHSGSLRFLGLACIPDSQWQHLSALSDCTNLEGLSLEAAVALSSLNNWETEDKQSFLDVMSWLKQCTRLKRLDMINVPSTASILAEVLKSPDTRLHTLKLKLPDGNEAFYASLGQQTHLKSLVIRTSEELLDVPATQPGQLISSVCACRGLVELDLMNTPLTFDDLVRFRESLPRLEELSFDGELVSDMVLRALARMDSLKTANINALSAFSFQGIMDFIATLATSSGGGAGRGGPHHGFQLAINQNGTDKFSEEEEQMLAWELESRLGGLLDIQYWRDPDEQHEDEEFLTSG